MTKTLYDIQGKPVKVGYLVAYISGFGEWAKGRVAEVFSDGKLRVEDYPYRRTASNVVVLEEPVWPNA